LDIISLFTNTKTNTLSPKEDQIQFDLDSQIILTVRSNYFSFSLIMNG
jgi:hypothetical protein